MRMPLCGAALAAASIFVASAADTALTKKKTPAPTAAVHKTSSTAAKTTPKTVSARTTAAKTSASRAKTHTGTVRRSTTTVSAARRSLTTWRNRQASPTPDRYREIQEALVAKGYLQPDDATGKWDQNSIDGLKRFQAEQKLDSNGRIDSLSLIALGLGPKYDSAPSQKPADPPIGQ